MPDPAGTRCIRGVRSTAGTAWASAWAPPARRRGPSGLWSRTTAFQSGVIRSSLASALAPTESKSSTRRISACSTALQSGVAPSSGLGFGVGPRLQEESGEILVPLLGSDVQGRAAFVLMYRCLGDDHPGHHYTASFRQRH